MIKRLFDISFSITVLLILSPLFFIIILSILIIDGRPIFFLQKRSGKNKIPFKFIKFRTMNNNYEIKEMHRITPLGNFLRRTSLDELPSFFNVLIGDMSVVGPRPLLEIYLERFSEFQIRRLEIKPGITGLAQVNGRNNLSWDKKFNFDVKYVDNQSFILDIKIILKTVKQVLTAKGVTAGNQIIMPEFKGNKE